jgi:hypothetical protein
MLSRQIIVHHFEGWGLTMTDGIQFELCPETGIGCLMIGKGEDSVKVDLMPDEVSELQGFVQSGDLAGAKAFLTEIEDEVGPAMGDISLEALAQELR